MAARGVLKPNPVGRPRRGPKRRVRTSFTLRPDDVAWLEEQARARGQSKSETLEECILLARRGFAEMRQAGARLIEKYPTVYWDVKSENVCGDRHSTFLIERMLESGNMDGVRDVMLAFSRKQIAEVVMQSRRISRKTALFWMNYLEIEGPARCLREGSQNPLAKP